MQKYRSNGTHGELFEAVVGGEIGYQ